MTQTLHPRCRTPECSFTPCAASSPKDPSHIENTTVTLIRYGGGKTIRPQRNTAAWSVKHLVFLGKYISKAIVRNCYVIVFLILSGPLGLQFCSKLCSQGFRSFPLPGESLPDPPPPLCRVFSGSFGPETLSRFKGLEQSTLASVALQCDTAYELFPLVECF